jgi:CHAT domain-containing protein
MCGFGFFFGGSFLCREGYWNLDLQSNSAVPGRIVGYSEVIHLAVLSACQTLQPQALCAGNFFNAVGLCYLFAS